MAQSWLMSLAFELASLFPLIAESTGCGATNGNTPIDSLASSVSLQLEGSAFTKRCELSSLRAFERL